MVNWHLYQSTLIKVKNKLTLGNLLSSSRIVNIPTGLAKNKSCKKNIHRTVNRNQVSRVKAAENKLSIYLLIF